MTVCWERIVWCLILATGILLAAEPVTLTVETVGGKEALRLQNHRVNLLISPARGGAVTSCSDKLPNPKLTDVLLEKTCILRADSPALTCRVKLTAPADQDKIFSYWMQNVFFAGEYGPQKARIVCLLGAPMGDPQPGDHPFWQDPQWSLLLRNAIWWAGRKDKRFVE